MDSFVDPVISDDYFYAVLFVGSPQSQRVEMALDTGSGLPYFACASTCTHCGKHDDKPYILKNSTSFEWTPCKDALCGNGHCKDNVCEWTQRYVDKSSISALVGSDLVSFYQYPHLPLSYYRVKKHNNNSIKPLQNEKKLRLTFGCSEREANTIYRQGADGVMGLSMHHRSFVDQLFNKNAAHNIDLGHKGFAHCFGEATGGLLLFGSIEIDDLIRKFDIKPTWTPFIGNSNGHGWYRTITVGFTVRYNPLLATTSGTMDNSKIDVKYASNLNSGYKGSVIDTGSSTLSMPRQPSQDIMNGILELVHQKTDDKFAWARDPSKNYDYFLEWNDKKIFNDHDWKVFTEKYMMYFPDIVMLWKGDGASQEGVNNPLEFGVPVQRYLLFKKPHICLDLFGDTPSILVGSNVMVNKFMIYDRENMKLGVADIDCDALVEVKQEEDEEEEEEEKKEGKEIDIEEEMKEVTIKPEGIVPQIVNEYKSTKAPTLAVIPDIGQSTVVTIHLANYYEIYEYFGVFLLVGVCVYCLCTKCRGDGGISSRSSIRYSAVSTVEPEPDLEHNDRKIPNHRRKKSVTNNLNNSYGNLHMDNMLSMTAPTQNFTSKQHKTQNMQQNNDTA